MDDSEDHSVDGSVDDSDDTDSSADENDEMKRCADFNARLNEHRKLAILCDVTILVEEKLFPVHKIVLAVSSSYFSAMFLNTFTEKGKKEIEIQGISAETFAVLLDFIYGAKIKLSFDNLTDLYLAGDMLCIDSLISKCRAFVMNYWNTTNDINGVYQIAKQCGMEDVLQRIFYNVKTRIFDSRFMEDGDVGDELEDLPNICLRDLSCALLSEVLDRKFWDTDMQFLAIIQILCWAMGMPEERLPDQALKLFSIARFHLLELNTLSRLLKFFRKMGNISSPDLLDSFSQSVEALYHKSRPLLMDYSFTVVLLVDETFRQFNFRHWEWDTVPLSLPEEIQSYILADGYLYVLSNKETIRKKLPDCYDYGRNLPARPPMRSEPVYSEVKGTVFAIGIIVDSSEKNKVEINFLQDFSKLEWHYVSAWFDSSTGLKSLRTASSVVHEYSIYFVVGIDHDRSSFSACFSYHTIDNEFSQVCTLSVPTYQPYLGVHDDILYVFPNRIIDLSWPARVERIDLKHREALTSL